LSKRVFVVDDIDDARIMLGMVLRQLGYDAWDFPDAASLIAACSESPPQAVIADLMMPRIDGFELARDLRERFGPDIRLIALTGLGPKAAFAKSRKAGFDYYLMKPVHADELVPYIEGAIEPEPE
jgi:CheY-like chemotaxis protein